MKVARLEQFNLLNLLESASIGVVIHATDTSVVYANPTALRLLRLSYDQIIGKDALDPQWKFVDEHNMTLPVDEYPVTRVSKGMQSIHNLILGAVDSQHNEVSWFFVNAYFEGDNNSDHGFIVVSFTDITERKQMFCFEDIVHDTLDVVIVTEAACLDRPLGPKIVYVNKACEKLTGYSAEEIRGETPRLLQGKDTDRATLDRIRSALELKIPCKEKVLNYAKNGTPYWIDMNIIPLKNRFGEVTHFAAIERDVTSAVHYEAALEQRNSELRALKTELESVLDMRTKALRQSNMKLQRIAHEDSLTGLPNRKSFMEQGAQHLASARLHNCCIGVAILDADYFKRINDEFGHDAGDEALKIIARVMQQTLRPEDVIGRIGGEEFAVCVLSTSRMKIEECLSRLREAIKHACDGKPFSPLTVSIGLCCVSGTYPDDLVELIKNADMAMYQAKNEGRNRLSCFVTPPRASPSD